MINSDDDTIVALSTPEGKGAIAIIRLSGQRAFQIIQECFIPGQNSITLQNPPLHKQLLGEIVHPKTEHAIDEAIVVMMKAPHSYTGEDMAEINCHGGYAVVQDTLECLVSLGARIAQPGEFTKRAFLNNKIDLAQAEAVCDVIEAQTVAAKNIAIKQLKGELSQRLDTIRTSVVDASAQIELSLDFPEEDVDYPAYELIKKSLNTICGEIDGIIKSGYRGRIFREGARVLLVGKPNVGKSSVFNALARKERAIVTPHPGTTRDTIECTVDLDGIPVTLVDSAGVRQSADDVEKIGIERTLREIETADVILVLVEADTPLSAEDFDLIGRCADFAYIPVLNKIDLEFVIDVSQLGQFFPIDEIVEISALKNSGIDDLERKIKQRLVGEESEKGTTTSDFLVTNLRHIELLKKTKDAVSRAAEGMEAKLSGELIMVDLYEALDAIGEITGHKVLDDVLNAIFSRFCIGK